MILNGENNIKSYLKIGAAPDLTDKKSRLLYRFLEIIPGFLTWLTLLGIVAVSRYLPVYASIFIIGFDIYWLIKTVFLSLHLRASYGQMKKNLAENWPEKLNRLPANNYSLPINPAFIRKSGIKHWSEIYHLIILPFYKEPENVIREAVLSIAQSDYPLKKERFIMVLGAEERAGPEASAAARAIKNEFEKNFFKFIVISHPAGIPEETAGKGSNETWAAKAAKTEIVDELKIPYENVLVSSLDIDTQVRGSYFSCLTYYYLTALHPLRSSFQPIPVYNNNIWLTPAFSRVVATSGTFWQMMQQARPERLATFSSHSIPLKALAEMGFWNVKNVSEDSRIFWKSLLFYDGDYRVVPLHYPVSMDANAAPSLWQTVKNVYKQQRRWGWGAENIPYLLFGFIKNKKIPVRRKLYFSFNQLEGFWSWSTNPLLIFLLGWLPPIIGGREFGSSVLAHNLPIITRVIMTLAMFGLVTSAIISTLLLPPRPPGHPFRKYLWMVLQWALVPFTIISFGAVPGIDSQTRLMFGRYMGFWVTPKWREKKM